MSQSPEDVSDPAAVFRYRRAWAAINTMLEQGRSLSGRERHCCFLNTGGQRFADVSAATGFDLPEDGRAICPVDWNNDGRLDFWISNRTSPAVRLLRNDAQSSHHFLKVKLIGRTCNRDAIGARVEVRLKAEPLNASESAAQVVRIVKSLRAGEGFLGQSSKWLHFGLGNADQIEELKVRWPGGKQETFRGLDADSHVIVEQGAVPKRWQPPENRNSLPPSNWMPPPKSDRTRTFMATRTPFPPTTYINPEGARTPVPDSGGPLLINLWATWCQPCLEELEQWAGHQDEFRKRDVRVLALCVDALDQGRSSDLDGPTAVEAAQRMLQRMGFPYKSGMATQDFVAVAEVISRSLIDKQSPLPVPSSILLDSQGRVAAIYRGPVDFETLLEDAELLDAPAEDIRKRAVHFPGRWFEPTAPGEPNLVVKNFITAGQLASAEGYLKADWTDTSDAALAEAWYHVGDARRASEDWGAAETAFRTALKYEVQKPRVALDLGIVLMRGQRFREAAEQFESVVRQNARDTDTRKRLVLALSNSGQHERTLPHAEVLVAQDPEDSIARLYLAKALKTKSRTVEAREQYTKALELRPGWPVAANELAWMLATTTVDEVRDEEQALELAHKACQATNYRHPALLDTLGAAQASAGQFDKAIDTAEKAIELARQTGPPGLVEAIEEHLANYRSGRPLTD